MTFEGLRKYICEPSKTRVLAFLHVACHGLAGAGCSGTSINFNPVNIDKEKFSIKSNKLEFIFCIHIQNMIHE